MKKRTLTARLISLWLVAALMLVGMPVIAQDHAAAPTTAAAPAVTDVAPAAETAAASSLLGPGELTLEQLALAALPEGDIPDALPAGKVAEKGHVNRLFEQEEGLSHILFQNRDGGKTAYFYGQPVKYIDADGHTRDKSKTLVPVNKTYGALGYDYGVEQNSIRHYYAKDPAVGVLVELGGHTVRIIPQAGASLVLPRGQLNENRMVYNNLFGTNTALVYTPLLSGVKEDIVLRSFTGQSDFAFTYRTSGLSLINIDGSYAFVDESGLPLATLGDILITDAAGHTALGSLTVTETAAGIYTVIVHADRAFLTAPTTVYPVTVDPTINETDNSASTILDYGLYSNLSAAPADKNDYHYLGYVSSTVTGRAIYQFPGFVKGNSVTSYASIHPDQIVNASLFVCGYPVSGDPSTFVTAYPITQSWNSTSNAFQNTALYNSCKSGTPSVRSLLTLDDFYSEIVLTDIVKAWLGHNMGDNTLPNPAYGVVLVDNTETNTGYQKKIRTVEGNDVDVYMMLDYSYQLPGNYYFSNVGLGGLLKKNTTTTATLPRIGSTTTDLSTYKWLISHVGSGHFAIRAAADPTRYLAASGNSVIIMTVSSSNTTAVPMAARWYIELVAGTGNHILTNASTLTVLTAGGSDTLQLSLQAKKAAAAPDYENTAWYLFLSNNFIPITSFSVSEDVFLSPGSSTTRTFSASYSPANATHTNATHYIWESDNTAFPFNSPGVLSIPASGGVANISVTNKITGLTDEFTVKRGILQDGIYRIRNRNTNAVQFIDGSNPTAGAVVTQSGIKGNELNWQLTLLADGTYSIRSCYSGLYLSMTTGSSNVLQQAYFSQEYSKWIITDSDYYNYRISPAGVPSNALNGSSTNLKQTVYNVNTCDWDFYSTTFTILNYYDSTLVNSNLINYIDEANEFVSILFDRYFGIQIEMKGVPTYQQSIADQCQYAGACQCFAEHAYHHKNVDRMDSALSQLARENNQIVVMWATRSYLTICETDEEGNHQIIDPNALAFMYGPKQNGVPDPDPVINVINILGNTVNETIANMANTLAHEIAHVFGLAEMYTDYLHEQAEGYCIMKGEYDEEALYELVVNHHAENGFCEACQGILDEYIEEVFFDEHMPVEI